MKIRCAVAAVACVVTASPAAAQVGTGNVYGVVVDPSGARLPGATLRLSGPFARGATSDAEGAFRFLRVDPGRFELTAALPGFATVTRAVRVTTNESLDLTLELPVAALEEDLVVNAETPVVDPRRAGTQSTLDKDEATRIPNPRDPWAFLRTVPGMLVARPLNVGGNESGQQAIFAAHGASTRDTTWSLDGVSIDDMAAGGAAPTYFDFDFFEEVAVTTSGNPVNVQTGGVGLNFVTRRGTNRWRGSAKGYLTHDALQWSNIAGTELATDPRLQLPGGGFADKANHVRQIADWGFDVGGPIVPDRLFVYGLYGRQDIRLTRLTQEPHETLLETFTGKLNWQVGPGTGASLFWFEGRKTIEGRTGSFGLLQPERAAWDQGNAYSGFLPFGIRGLLKLEVDHVFGPSLAMRASYSNYDTGFGLFAREQGPSALDFVDGTVRGNAWIELGPILRPLKHVTNLDGNAFFSGWGGRHELKFGFGYKHAPVSSSTAYGGRDSGLLGWRSPFGSTVWVGREGFLRYSGDFVHLYAGDSWTRGRVTASAGLRFDHQAAENRSGTVPASPSFPELLPAVEYPGGGPGIAWSGVSPRLSVSWALDEAKRTVGRASYGRYLGKLSTFDVARTHPVGPSYLVYLWNDLDGDGLPGPAEVDVDSGLLYYGNVDPADPTALNTTDAIDPDYRPRVDDEVVVGLDHALLDDLALSAAFVWRRSDRVAPWMPRIGLGPDDYQPLPPVTAEGFTAQAFAPDPEQLLESGGGRIVTNRPDAHRSYRGLELSVLKRLSRGWMLRTSLFWRDWREHPGGPAALQNPTRTPASSPESSGPQVDGGQVAVEICGGCRALGVGTLYPNAKWQLTAHGLYQLPAGFELGASLIGRQGFPRPITLRLDAGLDGAVVALATPRVDIERYPDLWNLDLRLAKTLPLGGDVSLMLEASMFNVLNAGTEQDRFSQANSDAFGRLDEILAPRIVRIGARLTF